ncbi:YbjN domain-containing protein [Xenorhabdus koppenhoeferi]|uniref:Sensory transduction regulator n=1 Tax=Xenorhabdus koppenhoeferi TaxID=351659 RepID=A0A1I7IZG4_9GAMM|nr:YbjN domain-containing protein [Xenorhabdus koppenhoeferi]SFU78339.1 Putative sensory transduction regulator [Xenorhabdus koppenhoeferi]
MDSMVIPDMSILRTWLEQLKISYFENDSCSVLHLLHMQNIDGLFDAKIDLLGDVLLFSALAEVRPTAIIPLVANLSQINASSLTVKAFLDVQDENLPKLIVCQAFSVAGGMTCRQFSNFMKQGEEQIANVIFEIHSNNLLYVNHDMESEMEVEDEEALISTETSTFTLH